jgi:hypothetical protein
MAGPLGKSGGLSIGKGGENDVESWHLQGCSSPPMSVKD